MAKAKVKKWTVASDDVYDKKHNIKEGTKKDITTDKKHGVYNAEMEMKKKVVKPKTKPNVKAPLGQGGRFAALAAKTSPAIAASIGRKKYGKAKFQQLAPKGK